MLRLIKHADIDKARWNQCLEASQLPLPYVYDWYLDIVSPGWDAIIDDNYEIISPLSHRTKAGIVYLFQPFFTQQFGCFAKSQQLLKDNMQSYYALLQQYAPFIQYQINSTHEFTLPSSFRLKQRQTHHLQLGKTNEILYKSYAENLRRNLKKYKPLLEVKETSEAENLIRIFKNVKGKDVSELRQSDYLTLQKLIEAAAARQKGFVVEVYYQQSCVAAAFILYNESFVVNVLNISNQTGRSVQAMSVLLDYVVNYFAGTNRILDFEGSDISGVAAFYRSFGSYAKPYWQIMLNQLPWHFRILKKLKDGLQLRRY